MTVSSYHHGDLKQALIQASLKILRTRGAESLSLRAVAAEVGVSHMAPYAHFKSKKSLFQAVAASGFDDLAESMSRNSQGLQKASEQILSYGVTYIEFALSQPQLYRLMLGQVDNTGRRSPQKMETTRETELDGLSDLQNSSKRPFDLLAGAFARISDNQIAVKAQALGAWSMVHGMAALLIEGHFEVPQGMTIKDFLAMAAFYKPAEESGNMPG